jgi:hypothetical protein
VCRFSDGGNDDLPTPPVTGVRKAPSRRIAAVRRFGRDRSEADMPRASEAARSDAYDPLRNSGGPVCCGAQRRGRVRSSTGGEGSHAATRVHHAGRWRDGRMAAYGARPQRACLRLPLPDGTPHCAVSIPVGLMFQALGERIQHPFRPTSSSASSKLGDLVAGKCRAVSHFRTPYCPHRKIGQER